MTLEEKLRWLQFAERVRQIQRRARRLSDEALLKTVRSGANRWFPADAETLILIEELLERYEKLFANEHQANCENCRPAQLERSAD